MQLCSWSSVRQIHNVRTIVADCLALFFFFLEKKRKRNVVWELAKMFETMVGWKFWRAINAQCVTHVDTVFFAKI